MVKCQYCGTKEVLPFKCPYCNGYFCPEHRLPESHECPEIWRARAPREAPPRIAVKSKTPYEYKITYGPQATTRKFWFSPTEIKHLSLSALLVMAVGLSIVPLFFGVSVLDLSPDILIVSSLIFVIFFISHEVAHKLVAQHYSLWAEFRLIMLGVLLTLISIIPFSPFKIISPGAVMIAGHADKETVGKTAIAGPTINLALAIVSFALYLFLSYPLSGVALMSVAFNAWIASFNLFPIGVLDGWKVFRWNKIVWALVFIPSLILTILTFTMF